MEIVDYKELEVWKKGIEIADRIYQLTEKFTYGLGIHMQRTAESISENIAEGSYRQYTKEYIQFCYISLGSCAELETQLVLAQKRRIVRAEDCVSLNDFLNHEIRMIRNMIKSLRERKGRWSSRTT